MGDDIDESLSIGIKTLEKKRVKKQAQGALTAAANAIESGKKKRKK